MTFIAWLRLRADTEARTDWLANFARWYIQHIGHHVSCWSALNSALHMHYGYHDPANEEQKERYDAARRAMATWHEQEAEDLRAALNAY